MLELILCAYSPNESHLLALKKKLNTTNKIVFLCLTGKKTLKQARLVGNQLGGNPSQQVL